MILIARAFDASRLPPPSSPPARPRFFWKPHKENPRGGGGVFQDGALSALSVSAEWLLG